MPYESIGLLQNVNEIDPKSIKYFFLPSPNDYFTFVVPTSEAVQHHLQ